MNYPVCNAAKEDGGLMTTELFNGHRVDMLWPGTGPMTDMTERAALKDLMRNIKSTRADFLQYPTIISFRNSVITPEEFVADDSIDPCTNNGQGKRLMYVTCIGGHVVGLDMDIITNPTIEAFPSTISHLTQLRHIHGVGNNAVPLTFPCEFGQLSNLRSLVWGSIFEAGDLSLFFPDDDSCMDGLINLQEVSTHTRVLVQLASLDAP
jgi:hypothetical protein